jgi:hypothetical protein
MLSARENPEASHSENELKRLVDIVGNGLDLGWIIDLHESLSELVGQASDIYSEFEELKESLVSGKLDLSAKSRSEIAKILRRLIAFNNKSQKERRAFEAVGLGECVYDAESQLKAVRKALRLIEERGALSCQ